MDSEPTSWLSRALNLLGIAVVTYYLFALPDPPAFARVVGVVALAGWLTIVLLPRRATTVETIALAVMVIAGAIATVPVSGLLIVPVAVAVLRSVATPARPIWHGITATLLGVALVAVGATLVPLPVLGLLSVEGGIVIAALAGVGRRQFRTAEAQSRAMLEEHARATVLAGRQAVARDIHDVLAHSLGGLILQLDAIDALLEAGQVPDAATRVRAARVLAADGLSEARRAVSALRDDSTAEAEQKLDLQAALDDLVEAHRALGGAVRVDSWGERYGLGRAETEALARLLQEAFTNARKHAPGATVMVLTVWEPDGVRFVVSNDLTDGGSTSDGGGYGLSGMAERFAALPDSEFSAAPRNGGFVVEARVGRR